MATSLDAKEAMRLIESSAQIHMHAFQVYPPPPPQHTHLSKVLSSSFQSDTNLDNRSLLGS
jgi:hypothetical protein